MLFGRFYFVLKLCILIFKRINVSRQLIHIVIKCIVLLFRFDESVGNFFKGVDSAFFLNIIERLFDHFHVLLVLLNHFELLLVGRYNRFETVLEEGLCVDCLRFIVLLEFEGFPISFVVHVVLL